MNLAEDQPLELAMRTHPWVNENWEGGCWFGNHEYQPNPSDGACRKDPAPGSVTGLCREHRDLLRAWSAGIDEPDPRPPRPRYSIPERVGDMPDLYVHGILIGDAP